MLKHGTYTGNNSRMKDKTALIMEGREVETVLIQADDITTGYGFGWHEFPASDWEIDE